jgi:hypothetical protein
MNRNYDMDQQDMDPNEPTMQTMPTMPAMPAMPAMTRQPKQSFKAPTSSIVNLTLLSASGLALLVGVVLTTLYTANGMMPPQRINNLLCMLFFVAAFFFMISQIYTESYVVSELRQLNDKVNMMR